MSIADELRIAEYLVEHLRRENEQLRGLLDDKRYIQAKADYNNGHLSHAGWLLTRAQAHYGLRKEGEP